MRKVVNHLKAPYGDIIENDTLTTRPKDFVYLKIEKKVQKIYLKDILYIESLKKYVKIRLKYTCKPTYSYHMVCVLDNNL